MSIGRFPPIQNVGSTPNLNQFDSVGQIMNAGAPNSSPRMEKPKDEENHFSLSGALSKVKGYFKRVGFALIGMDNPEKKLSQSTAFSVPTRISEEANYRDVDPMVGSWPTNFDRSKYAAPAPKSSSVEQSPENITKGDLLAAAQAINENEKEQLAALEVLKNASSGNFGFGAEDSEQDSL